MTPRQQKILKYIARHIRDHGYQPSVRELMVQFSIGNPNGIHCHLRALQREGAVSLSKGESRCIAFDWQSYL